MQTILVGCPLAAYGRVVGKIGHFAKPGGFSAGCPTLVRRELAADGIV